MHKQYRWIFFDWATMDFGLKHLFVVKPMVIVIRQAISNKNKNVALFLVAPTKWQ